MLVVMGRWTLVVLMFVGWGLTGLASADYLLGNLCALFTPSKSGEVWGVALGLTLSTYQTVYWRRNPFRHCWLRLKKRSPLLGLVARGFNRAGRLAHMLYRHLYFTADVLFCIGLPMLVVTALVGWWLIEEVGLMCMVLYLCLLLAISVIGIYSNAVRMLSLAYFMGYWVITPDWLSYPFAAPMRVQQNVDAMLAESGGALLVVFGVLCLLLYLARSSAASLCRSGRIQEHFIRRSFNIIRTKLDRPMVAGRVFFVAVLVPVLLVFLLSINSLIDMFNIHLFFAAIAIGLMDFFWKSALDNEPALSGDVQYLLSGLWRRAP